MPGSELQTVDTNEMSAVGQQFNWVGLNPVQIKSVAQAMALSGMFPDIQKDSAKAFVKIMAGQEMGIAPFQAMSDISIISGKAAPGGNIHASKVKSNGKYDYRVLTWDNDGCEIEFFEVRRDGTKESLGKSSFTKEDAVTAGVTNNPSYKKYPKNMYFNRAMTGGVRTFCPDVLNGVNAYTPEELGAEVDQDGRVIKVPSEQTAPPAAPAPTKSREDAPEAEVTAPGKTIIEQVGEALEQKGFTDSNDRKAIALTMAGVDRPGAASPQQWAEVLANIEAMNGEELAGYLEGNSDDAPEAEVETPGADEVAPVTDEELNALETPEASPAYVLPEFERGNSSLPRPEMRKLATQLFERIGLDTKVAQLNFTLQAIKKKTATTFDDYQELLEILASEVNAAADYTEGDQASE